LDEQHAGLELRFRRNCWRSEQATSVMDSEMDTPEEYLRYAEGCERLAEESSSGEDRETLLRMARAWRKCAQEASRHQREMN